MDNRKYRFSQVIKHPLRFTMRVVAGFRANQGLLLSGAVAYYTLLSVVPMFTLILVALSQLVPPQTLLEATAASLEVIAPGESAALTQQIATFISNWKLVGIVGLMILLFFSSLAFTALENAMCVIFHHRVNICRRHFLISAVIPFAYILLLSLGLFAVSTASTALQTSASSEFVFLGHTWTIAGAHVFVVHTLVILGELLMLTSLYLVMPAGRLPFRHALLGGITATILWELVRHFLIWYFANISLINVIYGSLTSAIVILLSVEAAAIILLFGAQVIAEYERVDSMPDTHEPLHT